MKHLTKISRTFFLLVLATFFITSCSNEDSEALETNQDTTELAKVAEIDNIDSAIGDIIIDVYETEESSSANRTMQPPSLPSCVTVTVVAQQNFREITIDFDPNGCLINGRTYSGQLVATYTRDPQAQQILINYTTNNFFVNNINLIGNRTILRELSNTNGNPQFTHTLNLTIIWPNGQQASRTGTKVREWIQGFGSGVWNDNVFSITGNWNTNFVNGNSHSYTVNSALIREVTCPHFVSGSVDVQRTNFGGNLDFGNGTCDNVALFTFNNGTTTTITLN